ncbi:hypothetical protein ACKA04_01910 [Helcococcus kunzii]|uniref:hypothetical protein n=1 Tax=Helcococcus kunzii TaxID=40091 RepID=UPI0038A71470
MVVTNYDLALRDTINFYYCRWLKQKKEAKALRDTINFYYCRSSGFEDEFSNFNRYY